MLTYTIALICFYRVSFFAWCFARRKLRKRWRSIVFERLQVSNLHHAKTKRARFGLAEAGLCVRGFYDRLSRFTCKTLQIQQLSNAHKLTTATVVFFTSVEFLATASLSYLESDQSRPPSHRKTEPTLYLLPAKLSRSAADCCDRRREPFLTEAKQDLFLTHPCIILPAIPGRTTRPSPPSRSMSATISIVPRTW